MRFGVLNFLTSWSIRPDELGRALEARPFDSYWAPEHTHIPVHRASPWPGGGDIPPEYAGALDPFVSLMAVGAATSRLLLGTGVCLVVERDPITTAKTVATLDFLSGGRVRFGVGAGWNVEEMANHGTDPDTRFRLLRERIAAMRAIWTDDEAEFHGTLVDFDPIWSGPKPLQPGGPPVLIGGGGPHVLDRVVAYGDGWAPRVSEFTPAILGQVRELHERVADAGRARVDVTVMGTPPSVGWVDDLAAAGVDRVVLPVPCLDRDAALTALDTAAEFAAAAGAIT